MVQGYTKRRRYIDKFLGLISVHDDGCWYWLACIATHGYGLFCGPEKLVLAHRFSYESFVGKIPKKLVVHHKCRNRRCVNPGHLEAITNKENVLMGIGVTAENARKTRCKRGHNEFYFNGQGRACRVCARLHVKNFAIRKRIRAQEIQQPLEQNAHT